MHVKFCALMGSIDSKSLMQRKKDLVQIVRYLKGRYPLVASAVSRTCIKSFRKRVKKGKANWEISDEVKNRSRGMTTGQGLDLDLCLLLIAVFCRHSFRRPLRIS